jgi:hypothetical protein
MRHVPWRESVLVLAIGVLGGPREASAQTTPPNDETPGVFPAEEDPDARSTGVEQDDPILRLAWERKAWGLVTPTFRKNAIKEGKLHSDKKNAPGPKWVSLGPTGADYEQNGNATGHVRDSGRARTILAHPTDPDIVYFLTSGGGLWRTSNWTSPQTLWQVLTDNLPTTGGGAVAFGRDPNTLYLGLGDSFDQILVGGAMTRSRNAGNSWTPVIELGNAVSVRDVKVDTSTDKDIVLVATDSGLFRSANGGDSYSAVATFAGLSVWSIVRTSAGWLASAQPCSAAGVVGLFCREATTLYLSANRGVTWAPISNAGNVFSANGRTTLAVAVPGESVVYAYSSTQDENELRDVYRSADGGQTWVANNVNSTKIPTNPVSGTQGMPNMNICRAQCGYDQMILVDPQDPARDTVWIGGDLATARTTDGGATWTIETWWLFNQVPSLRYAHADHQTALFKTTGTPTLILGNDGGLNVSEDNGATFSSDKNNGLVSHLYYTVAGNKAFPNLVIGGTQDNGIRLRTDNSSIHNQVSGGDGMGTAYSHDNTNTVMGSSQSSALRGNFSNNPPDVFQNWTFRGALADPAGVGFFTAIVPAPTGLDASGRVFFHFTNSRVWRTDNGGLNWTLIGSAGATPGLPANRRFRSSSYNLGVSPTDLKRIAVGAAGGFVDVTTDGGTTWTDINLIAAVPGYQGFVTNVTWQDSQTLWITAVAQAPGAVRVIKASIPTPATPWSAATFIPRQSGLPDLPITRVYFDPRDASRNTIYAATHVGIYRTLDGGASWAPYGNGLPTVRVNDIYMPPDGGFIRIATYGRGIWELPQLELASTALTDAPGSCDNDGVLDNGEKGRLSVTIHNQGPNAVNDASLTFTSSNPHVTFPSGNVLDFPPIPKFDESTASIPIALNGAAGIESTDIEVAVSSPQLGFPSALNVVSTHRLNYDVQPQASSTETFEPEGTVWTTAGDPTTLPNINAWQRRALSPIDHVYWGPDNNGTRDEEKTDLPDQQVLVSPTLHVGSDPLTISFRHRFAFEVGGWDGGVVEISTDGGSSWTDVGGAAYNGAINALSGSPIGGNHPAFVNRMAGWPNFATVNLDLGTTYANQDVKLRFRVGADQGIGAPGWDVDDIAVSGLTVAPFPALVANAGSCQ